MTSAHKMSLSLLAVVLVICIIFLLKCLKSNKHLPPLMEGSVPIFGHTLLLLGKSEDLYYRFMKYFIEPAMRNNMDVATINFCISNIYIIHNAEDASLLLNQCLQKDVFFNFFKPWLGEYSLVTASGIHWKRHRKLLVPTFHQKILTGFLSEMNRHARRLAENLERRVGTGPFDHFQEIKNITLQSVCATSMGANMNDEDNKTLRDSYLKSLEVFTNGIIERTSKFWLMSDFIYSFSSLRKQQLEHVGALKQMSNSVIEKRKSIRSNECIISDDPQRYKASLDLMLELGEAGQLSEEEIRQEVDTLLTAGVDTTSAALAMALLLLAAHPRHQRAVQHELTEVFGDSDRDVDRQDLTRLTYLEAVIKETLRLYPVIIGTARYVEKDLQLKSCTIPAGSRVFVSFPSVLRGAEWGADAASFRPERWRSAPAHHHYPAFGLGKRSCIGVSYALMSLKTSLAHVLRRYQLRGDTARLRMRLDIVVKPVAGHHIAIEYK